MTHVTDGLVIREQQYNDTDKLLTILTPEYGRVRAMAKGARRIGSHLMPPCQLFAWGNYALSTRGDLHWVREASLTEPFFGLRVDLRRLTLATYFCDIAYEASGENSPAADILPVILNTFYALAHGRTTDVLIKGAYELRIAAMSGYCPDLSACSVCGSVDAEGMYLDVMGGCLICADCMQKTAAERAAPKVEYDLAPTVILLPVPPGALAAMRYILSAPANRLFSFRITDAAETADFSRACETFLLNHFERGFPSLQFYYDILYPPKRKI